MPGYLPLPWEILADPKLRPGEKLILAILRRLFNEKKKYAWPSKAALVEKSGQWMSRVELHLKVLKEAGYIQVTEQPGFVNRYGVVPYETKGAPSIPDDIACRKDLSPGAKLAYGRITKMAGSRCYAQVPLKTLGMDLGISQKRIRRLVQELVKKKLLWTVQISKGDTCFYYIESRCKAAERRDPDMRKYLLSIGDDPGPAKLRRIK